MLLLVALRIAFLFGILAHAAPAPQAPAGADTPPALPAGAGSEQVPIPRLPVRWRTHFGDSVPAGETFKLEWHGGDSNGYEVYYVPRWAGQVQYDFVTIEANTTETSIDWLVPALSEYPEGTEFIFGVKDGSRGPDFDWYDLSASIPLR